MFLSLPRGKAFFFTKMLSFIIRWRTWTGCSWRPGSYFWELQGEGETWGWAWVNYSREEELRTIMSCLWGAFI